MLKRLAGFIFVLGGFSISAYAACAGSDPNWIAAAWTDIQICHDSSASDGDTITYTGASVAATVEIAITKAVTITRTDDCTKDGNNRVTSCSVVITNNVATGAGAIFNVTLSTADLITRISNFEFADGSSAASYGHILTVGANSDGRRFAYENLMFDNSDPSSGYCVHFRRAYGVLANSTLHCVANVGVGHVYGDVGGSAGHENWYAGSQLGTDKYVYFDNVTAIGTGGNGLIDAHAGGRYVFRKSTLDGGNLNNHGNAGSGERGGMEFEVYSNLLTSSTLPPYHSQGTGVLMIWGNWVVAGDATPFVSQAYRMFDANVPYGAADGHNLWDENDDVNNPYATGTVTSATGLTVTDSMASFSGLSGYAIRKTGGPSVKTVTQIAQESGSTYRVTSAAHGYPGPSSISSLTRSGTTATATVGAHTLLVGQNVRISGADQMAYNGDHTITGVTGTTFTYTMGSDPGATATGTLVLTLYVSLYGDALNTGNKTALSNYYAISNVTANTFDITLNEFAGTPSTVSSGEMLATVGMWTSEIVSHNGQTITFYGAIYGAAYYLTWVAGDTYEANRVIHLLDDSGRTGGSLVTTDVLPDLPMGWNDQTTIGARQWSNRRCPSGPPTVNCASNTAVNFNFGPHFIEGEHYYNEDTGFDGTSGIGVGDIGDRPGTCTAGVSYWATDEGEWDSTNGATPDGRMYKCTNTDEWTLSYTPYLYPHPLTAGDNPAAETRRPLTRLRIR